MKSKKKKTWIRFWICLGITILFLLFALFGSVLAPYDPLETDYTARLEAPSAEHLFGTDQLGRDIFSRILYGGKTSLFIAFAVTMIVAAIGILLGVLAGYWGGAFDMVLMRISDMLMAFPGMIFTIAIVAFFGTGVQNLILAMTITGWTSYARISRSLVLSLKNNTYIEQARLGGAGNVRIVTAYILPNIMPALLVNITQDMGSRILTLAGLSLLGLGSQPPTPEWGYMLAEGKDYMYSAPWMLVAPGLVILISVIVFNLLGDALQDLMNPKQEYA